MMDFEGKVVLIIGGSSGIGAATAVSFAKNGATVCIVGRNLSKLEEITDTIKQHTEKFLIIPGDISKDEDMDNIIKTTIDTFGKLDVLINNAAILKLGSLLDGKLLEVFDETIRINLRATVYLTTLAVPYLMKTKGNVIMVSSVVAAATSQLAQQLSYGVSKAGMEHFARFAALQLAPSGIRVNCVRPGPVETDILSQTGYSEAQKKMEWTRIRALTALNRLSEPEEVADMIEFLASDKAKSITGAVFNVDNGRCLDPHKRN